MALSGPTIWDVRPGASDTANGGGFNPGNANFPTDLTTTANTGNTASPIVSSASYNFVAGDVNAWVYIKSGTNWNPGWYQIASVASNQATLSAGIGQAYVSTNNRPVATNTTVGVATVGTPTSGTWGVDYSQQTAAQFTFNDMTIGAAGATFTSAGHPVGKNFVGNLLQVTGGTNATVGVYEVLSTSGITATLDRNWATGASSNGAGGLGGSFASPGMAGSVKVIANDVAMKAGTYTLTTTSQNVATGPVNETTGGTDTTHQSYWFGWNTTRTRVNRDTTQPTILGASGLTAYTLFQVAALNVTCWNFVCDGNARATTIGFGSTSGANFGGARFMFCRGNNCTSGGFSSGADTTNYFGCSTTGCSTTASFTDTGSNSVWYTFCAAYSNTITGFLTNSRAIYNGCIAANNSGASSDGFGNANGGTTEVSYDNCTSYNNGRDGFRPNTSSARQCVFSNCVSVKNAGLQFGDAGSVCDHVTLLNCAADSSGSGSYTVANQPNVINFQSLPGDPFKNGAALDFTPLPGSGIVAQGYQLPQPTGSAL